MKNSLRKIVITGPESTGKSTIAQALAVHFDTVFVPEYAREYLNSLGREYNYDDLLLIAKGQMALEDELSKQAKNNLLFCDTDLLVIMVWCEHKFGKCHSWILEQLATRAYDFYFLTNIDFPWAMDPLREHPEPEMRSYFFKLYQELLIQLDLPFALLSGGEDRRLERAVEVVEQKWNGFILKSKGL